MIEFFSRREVLGVLGALGLSSLSPKQAHAFGEEGAFHARILKLSDDSLSSELSASRRWAWELIRRTSAPGRLASQTISPVKGELLQEPFAVWSGEKDPGRLDSRAIRSLRKYFRMGGTLVVDDRIAGEFRGKFSMGARRELSKVLPESGVVQLPANHVLFKTFYILEQPQGRIIGPSYAEAIVRGNSAQVIFLNHDLLGALARRDDNWENAMEQGGSSAREYAIRFAVNIAMYVLCSDYKDDQVHAPFLMRRRHKKR